MIATDTFERDIAGFQRQTGVLCAERVAVPAIAQTVGTPFYCYSTAMLRQRYLALRHALRDLPVQICYAVKANGNLSILRCLARLGAGADVVSGGELLRAVAAGIPANRIAFSGVGKTEAELCLAANREIAHVNVESESELHQLDAIGAARGRRIPVLLRVNPDIDAKTHVKINTGGKESKFGIPHGQIMALFAAARQLAGIELAGLAMHIGSQISDMTAFHAAYRMLAALTISLRQAGYTIRHLDLGGGLAVDYVNQTAPDFGAYARLLRETVGGLGCALTIEPGRALVADAGILITRVLHAKATPGGLFVIVDAAMNDFMRPALYDATHRIEVVEEMRHRAYMRCHIAGPVCESSDVFCRDLPLPQPKSGELLAIWQTGAYGAVLASTYNARPLIPEVMVDQADYAVIRQPLPLEQMLELERYPAWLQ